jgi:surfeit locus 1 family protein
MIHLKAWTVVGVLLAAAAGFAALGRWQLDRAEVNQAIEASYADAANEPVLDSPVTGDHINELRYRRIRLRGRYLPAMQILLDNMISNGRAGYEVLTPFRPDTGDRLVLVNRGWVPASPDRRVLPEVMFAGKDTIVTGRVDRLPRAALELGAPPAAAPGPLVVMSFPTASEIEAVLARKVYAFELLLDADAEHGFERDWAAPRDMAMRNIAYAVQWFGLAGLALAIATGFVIRRYRRTRGVAP